MIDRKNLHQGLSHAAWGYFFLTVDFNLGTVSIFPSFVGYLLFLSAIGKLKEERRDLALLRPLCILLASWSFLNWGASWFGGSIDGQALFLDLLIGAAGLYFQFQFLTDLAALAETYQGEEQRLDVRLRRWRNVYVVLVTAVSVMSVFPQDLFSGQYAWVVLMPLGVTVCLAAFAIMKALFELRKCVRGTTETEPPSV